MSKAQGLRHLQAAKNGQDMIPEYVVSEQLAEDIAIQEANIVPTTNRVFKLLDTRKGDVYVNGEDYAINPKTKTKEKIRLLSHTDSIWESEQRHLTNDYIKANRRSLKFEGGKSICLIPLDDAASCEYASICSQNIGGPNGKGKTKHAFFEWDTAKQQEEALKKDRRRMEAMQIAFTEKDMVKIQKHLTYLGIRLVDQFGFPYTPDGLTRVYASYADKYPDRFLDTEKLPAVEVSWLVKKALADAKIDLGRQPNSAFWATGGFICQVPGGITDTLKYLVEYAMLPTEEGKNFLSQLQQVVR